MSWFVLGPAELSAVFERAAPTWSCGSACTELRCWGSVLQCMQELRPELAGGDAAQRLEALARGWQLFRERSESRSEVRPTASSERAVLVALLAELAEWALAAARRPTRAPLTRGDAWDVPAEHCRDLLASAFWGNLHDTTKHLKDNHCDGGLTFHRMFSSQGPAADKCACLWAYFHNCARRTGPDERTVRFEYLCAPTPSALSSEPSVLAVEVHGGVMEDVRCAGFVNFANRNFGYGKFTDSCTQEEILQMCCPEFNVGMLVLGQMADDECVVVRCCRRFSAYTGYAHSFQFAQPYDEAERGAPAVQDILTMDACFARHFSEEQTLRDVRKASLAFAAVSSVSSGRWGCGVFGGAVDHKMLQQICAAQAAGCTRLALSAFGDELALRDGRAIARSCAAQSPAQTLGALLRYSRHVHDGGKRGVVAFLDQTPQRWPRWAAAALLAVVAVVAAAALRLVP